MLTRRETLPVTKEERERERERWNKTTKYKGEVKGPTGGDKKKCVH